MDKLFVLFLFTLCCCVSTSIKINFLKVPKEIDLEIEDDVVLDCEFELQNKNDSVGLEIKWFHVNEKHQVYQWVPGRTKPQAMGILKDRLDLKYSVSNDTKTKHSALKITNITSDLSGPYTCKISSFFDEASATEKMVIYEPAKEFQFIPVDDDNGTVVLICTANGISPKPVMDINPPEGNATRLSEEKSSRENNRVAYDGDLYNITSSFKFLKSEVDVETQFTCDLKIPDTNYHKTLTLQYYPGGEPLPELETDIDMLVDYESSSTETESSAFTLSPGAVLISGLALLLSTTTTLL